MKRLTVILALLVGTLTGSLAEGTVPVVKVNGTELTNVMTSVTFSGNVVVINYTDGANAQFSLSDDIVITFSADGPTGIQPQSSFNTFEYRKAIDGSMEVSGIADGTLVTIYSVTGEQVLTGKATGGVANLDVSGLTSGTYILRAGSNVIKFMKR